MRPRAAWTLAVLAAVAAASGAGIWSWARDSRIAKRMAWLREISEPLVLRHDPGAAAALPADPLAARAPLVRALLRVATDPNVSADEARTAVLRIGQVAEDAGEDCRPHADALGIADRQMEALVLLLADADPWNRERHLDELAADWTGTAGLRHHPFATSGAGAEPREAGTGLRDVVLPGPPGVSPWPEAFAAHDAAGAADPVAEAPLAAWRRGRDPFEGIPLRTLDDGWVLAGVPRTGFHVWTRTADGRACYHHVPPDALQAPPADFELRPLAGRPVIGGEPARAGVILVAGRLDWSTAQAMTARACRAARASWMVHEAADFGRARIAAADWITAVGEAGGGIAYLRFDGHSAPDGDWEPGSILVRSAAGGRFATRVRLRSGSSVRQPEWSAGTARRAEPDPDPAGGARVFTRLPLGEYVVTFDEVQEDASGAWSSRPRGAVRVRLDEDRLHAEVTEPSER